MYFGGAPLYLRDIPAAFVLSLLNLARDRSESIYKDIIEQLPFGPRSIRLGTASVTYDEFIMVLHKLNQPDRLPGIVFDYANHRKITELGLFAYALTNAETFGKAMDVLLAFDRFTISVAHRMEMRDDKHLRLVGPLNAAELPYFIELCEESATGFHNVFKEIISSPTDLRLVRFGFPYDEPAYGDKYRRFFGSSSLAFGQSEPWVSLPASWMSRKIPRADVVLGQLSLAQCERELAKAHRGYSATGRIQSLMETRSDGHRMTLQEAADTLLVTPRQLSRSLRNEETSFRELQINDRMQRACDYLVNRQFDASRVATLLGYSQPSAFARAFKTWSGMAPGSYRKKKTAELHQSGHQSST